MYTQDPTHNHEALVLREALERIVPLLDPERFQFGFPNVLDSHPHAIFVLGRRGEIIYLNHTWEIIFEHSVVHALGHTLNKFLPLNPELFKVSGSIEQLKVQFAHHPPKWVRLVWHHSGDVCVGSIENLNTHHQRLDALHQQLHHLEDAVQHSIEMMGQSLSPYHPQLRVDYGRQFAQVLQLSPEDQKALLWGLWLQDIGMSVTERNQWFHSRSLSPSERAAMEQHPQAGLKLAEQLSFLPQATRDIIYSHHESYDGSGYPQKLRSDEIPQLVRIASIVDRFCALVSERPYRAAYSIQEAGELMYTLAGNQLDPYFCYLFVDEVLKLA